MLDRKSLIMMILVIVILGASAVAFTGVLNSGTATRQISEISDASTYFDTDNTRSNITLKVDHPQYGMELAMPFLRPFTKVTAFAVKDPYDSSVTLFNVTLAANNKATIAKTASVTGNFNIVDTTDATLPDTAGSVNVTVPKMSDTVGLEPIFPKDSEAYLEEFFEGFIPFRDSEFYATYKTSPTSISTNTKAIFKNLATALFETYEFLPDGSLVAAPLANSYDIDSANTTVTIMGITRPDVSAALNYGKVSNNITREKGLSIRYVHSLERNRDYIEAIVIAKVFDGVSAGKETVIASLVDSIMQMPNNTFIVPDKNFKEHPETKLPVVRAVN